MQAQGFETYPTLQIYSKKLNAYHKILIQDKNKKNMVEVIDTIKILSELEKNKDPGKHFIDFLHNNSFEAGILRLSPGQKDIQDAHGADELYFVIEGTGFIRILQKDHAIKKGSCIFVHSNTKHYFHGNENNLVVLYVFNVSH